MLILPPCQSQLDPLPRDLPFRIISKTIGRGAYASIKKAIPPTDTTPIFAVKFIHKAYAVKHGRISAKQIAMEVSLHSHIGQHPNIIEWFATGEDAVWKWIAMEYAEGGDLFDKIEADVGVSEDIAHFYFSQLIGGVSFMHSKGVGHRDIKPENILLSDSGNLKIADFGLATLFEYNGNTKLSTTMCGSPPYIAPEVITCSKSTQSRNAPKASGYAANLVDIWSCGVVLFVLLVGNTPWDEPTSQSWEFEEYTGKKGRSTDDLWQKLPGPVLSLLRGMMNVDTSHRFSFEQIKRHPWYTRSNHLLTSDGKMTDPLSLATQMLEGLRIDFSQRPTASQRPRQSQDAMDIDTQPRFSFTQPETPINDVMFDWERPPRTNATNFSASQPTHFNDGGIATMTNGLGSTHLFDSLADEPSMSQFTPAPSVPLSLTQHARRFRDIVPNYSLTRFFSHLASQPLLQLLSDALHQLNVPIPAVSQMQGRNHAGWIKVKLLDGRHCSLSGDIVVDTYEGDLLEVRFVKVKGDPLEWRRFFKNVVVLCKEGVYVPGA
ncbi:Serine/threonine-protein kinase chk1 [Lachnellula suecica]|uniref:non-specific serine/threonine protein kinase n=1 Tax=Lachnellula suecica TaxID=602035 RepID=A0A8T9C7T0_9HELO|nr:Serine/threonine-protein kinase chk1 [Lachnellula suecica]